MLIREKDTYSVFTRAMTRNLAFLRLQRGLDLVTEYMNYSFEDSKPDLLKRIPESLKETPLYGKLEESGDLYGLIECLTDTDVPGIVDHFHCLPFAERVYDVIPRELIDAEIISLYLPQIKESVQLVRDNPLYQDILVSSVSAFEVYLRDTLHDLIINNHEIAQKFLPRVMADLNFIDEPELNRGVMQMIAHHITRWSSFYNMNRIESLFQTCFEASGKPPFRIHPNNRKINAVQYYMRVRNLFVHTGGIVDSRFLKETRGCPYTLGEKYRVKESTVDEVAGLILRMAELVERAIQEY